MTSRLIGSVAALALLASGGLVFAQDTGGKGPNGASGGKEMGTGAGGGGKSTGAAEKGSNGPSGTRSSAEHSGGPGEKGEKAEGAGGRTPERAEKAGDRDRDHDRADRGDRDHDRVDRGDHDRDRADRGDRDHEKGARGRDVDFNVRVGGVVPEGRRLTPLRADLVTRYPQYRGFNMVVVNDEVVIVDPGTRKVVRTVSEGSAGMDHRATDCR